MDPQRFEDSIRAIFQETVEERRMAMFDSLLEKAGPKHYASVVSLIRENDLRGNGNAGEWSMLWAKWGSHDPAGALEFIKTQDWAGWNSMAPVEAKNKTLTYWAQTDPEGARVYVEGSSELAGGDRSLVYGLVRGWANIDPAAAAAWIFKSGLGMEGEYKAVVEALSRKGGQESLDAWFSEVLQSGAPAKDLGGFAKVIAGNKLAYEPEKGALWVEQHLDEPWMQGGEIVRNTAEALAQRDPGGAMEWAGRINQEGAAAVAMDTWCRKDLQAAQTWMDGNPQSEAYSGAAMVLAVHLQRQRGPEAARKWAESIPDDAVREPIIQRLGGR